MSLSVCSLNSGSNGNCYYISNKDEAVLIDAGVPCREMEKRMMRLGLSIKKVKAIFITHEHSDHIGGIHSLSKKYRIPIYITDATVELGKMLLREDLRRSFRAYEPIDIGGLSVIGFPKIHDAADPHSFIIRGNGITVGVFTDIGLACEHVIAHFKQCHAAFLESNYDEEMLDRGKYPIFLKNRIRDGKGHLSNRQARQLFVDHRPSFMTHLFLSHLSRINNSPKIAKETFASVCGATEIIIASRERESELYRISTEAEIMNQPVQLSMF
jgi:phosphoribosyl 1,2-cyclic phosphodiesterase